jgi:hypothetical protein
MFIDNFFVDNVIKNIFSKQRIEIDEPIFREFNDYLKELGLDIVLTTFFKQPKKANISDNSSDNGNDIAIYLRTGENFNKNGLSLDHNWNGNYRYTNDIIEKWKQLAIKFNYPEAYYDYIAHVFIYDFENTYLTELISSAKPELISQVKKTKWKIKPEYIFKTSVPEYNIVYAREEDYKEARVKGYFEDLINVIHNLLKKHDFLNIYKPGSVKISFLHTEMGINLYGLSRED